MDITILNQTIKKYYSGLLGVATNGSYSEDDYSHDREFLLKNKEVGKLIPSEITQHYTAQNFRVFMQEKGGYAERKRFITDALSPAINYVEKLMIDGDSFSLNEDAYELGEQIGYGGFGKVYKYHHKLLDMPFAIKVFEPLFASESETVEGEKRFFREAKMLFHLKHDNIANVYDIGRTNGKPFMRLEYIEGQNLGEWIKKMGGVSFERSKKPIQGILKGMGYAHDCGVIHRDLKPSNVMVKNDGVIKLIDFGISAYVETADHTKLTKTGEQISGGRYTDPRLTGEPSLRDVRSDIYSIGAIWFFVLTNRDPSNDARNVLMQSDNATSAQADIILRCLNSNADERFQSCKELLDLLFYNEVESINGTSIKRISANNITRVTKTSIMKYFTERKFVDGFPENNTSFNFHGDLGVLDFLKRLYSLDVMPHSDGSGENMEYEIQSLLDSNDELDRMSEHGWNNYEFQNRYEETYHHFGWHWIFTENRFSLINGDDDVLLRLFCETLHPEVRNWLDNETKLMCMRVINEMNNLLIKDGYELYEDNQISGRPVYSYRYCL